MVYVLDKADRLCGVSYIDWSKRYSQIPKATCEQLEGQCDGIQIDFDCSLDNSKGNGVTPTPTPIPEEKVIDMACVGKGKEDIIEDLKKLAKDGEDPILEIETGGLYG